MNGGICCLPDQKILSRENGVYDKVRTVPGFVLKHLMYVRSMRAFRVQTKIVNIPAFVMEFTWYRILYTRFDQGCQTI